MDYLIYNRHLKGISKEFTEGITKEFTEGIKKEFTEGITKQASSNIDRSSTGQEFIYSEFQSSGIVSEFSFSLNNTLQH